MVKITPFVGAVNDGKKLRPKLTRRPARLPHQSLRETSALGRVILERKLARCTDANDRRLTFYMKKASWSYKGWILPSDVPDERCWCDICNYPHRLPRPRQHLYSVWPSTKEFRYGHLMRSPVWKVYHPLVWQISSVHFGVDISLMYPYVPLWFSYNQLGHSVTLDQMRQRRRRYVHFCNVMLRERSMHSIHFPSQLFKYIVNSSPQWERILLKRQYVGQINKRLTLNKKKLVAQDRRRRMKLRHMYNRVKNELGDNVGDFEWFEATVQIAFPDQFFRLGLK